MGHQEAVCTGAGWGHGGVCVPMGLLFPSFPISVSIHAYSCGEQSLEIQSSMGQIFGEKKERERGLLRMERSEDLRKGQRQTNRHVDRQTYREPGESHEGRGGWEEDGVGAVTENRRRKN